MIVDVKLLFHNFMKYGAIFGLLISVSSLGMFFLINPKDFELGQYYLLLFSFFILPWISGLYFVTKKYRDNELGGYISMPEILQFSVFVGFFGGAIYVLSDLLFVLIVGLDYKVHLMNTYSIKYISLLESQMKIAKVTQADIDAMIMFLNGAKEQVAKGVQVTQAIMSVVYYSFFSLITMLIFGWFIRKIKPLFPTTDIKETVI